MSTIKPLSNEKKENSFLQLNDLIESINDNHLNQFYPSSSESIFKRNIDDLNLAFYLETERILSERKHNVDIVKSQDKLFIILFKQISLYIKEIERLNHSIANTAKDSNEIKGKMSFISKQKDEYETNHQLIQALKYSITSLETKLSQALLNENKWKAESELLKKENKKMKEIIKNAPITPFFHNENSHRSGGANNEVIDSTSLICATAHIIPKKKRHLSDNNAVPFPITYKKNEGVIANSLQNNNNKGNGNSKSPYMKHSANKVTNFKIIKHIKQRLKSEDENCKINSPRTNYRENDKESFIKNTINDNIPYENHLNDLNQIEAMMIDIKKTYFPSNDKPNSNYLNNFNLKNRRIPQLTSITLNQFHNNNSNNTPHFELGQSTYSSFQQSHIFIEGKNDQ